MFRPSEIRLRNVAGSRAASLSAGWKWRPPAPGVRPFYARLPLSSTSAVRTISTAESGSATLRRVATYRVLTS